MSHLRIDKGFLPESVIVPSSKSYANRALILGALKDQSVQIHNLPKATDVTFLVNALKAIGLEAIEDHDSITIANSFHRCEKEGVEIDIGEGGTTARFLAAMLLLGKSEYILNLGNRLKSRPWEEFLRLAKDLGASASLQDNKLRIKGPIRRVDTLKVDCSQTTQFATAFGLVLPETKIETINLEASQSYWLMNGPIRKELNERSDYVIPKDWSSAAFPMVFGALNQRIFFPELAEDPFQADSKILGVLKKIEAVEIHNDGIAVNKFKKRADIELDMSDCLDLFPAMVFLVSHIKGEHILRGIENLVHKESDRLLEMRKILDIFAKSYEVDRGLIRIFGDEDPRGSLVLDLPDDHRIVMVGSLFLRHHNGGEINRAEAVEKSYPSFFELLK